MSQNYHFLSPCLTLLFLTTTSFASQTNSNGFTIDLIRRDSPHSPLHNPPSISKWDRLSNAFQRSTSRSYINLHDNSKNIQSSILAFGGEYLMNISIGTPPIPMLGIADTGSDLIWTQCKPCLQCYDQKTPIFDPNKSSSYKKLPCQSNACHSIGTSTCNYNFNTCSYRYSYGDNSHTIGDLVTETISFSGQATFDDIIIGCGHDNGGTFNENGSGLIGLGGGRLSLVSQLTKSLGGKFAYCLVPYSEIKSASKMSFGSNAIVSNSPGVVSTPLVKKDPSTFYFLTLESVSIGDRILSYKATLGGFSGPSEKGNIIIDSGTTLTLLPPEFYSDLVAELEKVIRGERVDEPQGILSLCYRSKGDLEVPMIKAKFEGGEVELKADNTFVRVQEDVMCLAMSPASDVAIFGNVAQMDFLVSYDLQEGMVSFKPIDCSKHE